MQPEIRVQRSSSTGVSNVVLVANAHASGVRPGLIADLASECRRWGARVATLVTESADEWIEAVRQDPERRVVLVGGDGTIHAAANQTVVRPELAIIPAGRANNVARSLRVPLDPGAAARLAVEGRVHPVDLAEAVTPTERHVVVEAVSVGLLAEARSYYHAANSADLAAALAAGARALSHYRPLSVRLTTSAGTSEHEVGQLFVANLPLYAFGLHVAPQADPGDQLLDVVEIDPCGRAGLAAALARLARGHTVDMPAVHRWRAECVRIDTDAETPVVADSDRLGSGPVVVRVLPRALPLVRP